MDTILSVIGALVLFAITLFVFSWLLQITYNASVVNMAQGASTITFWQAMALLVFIMIVGSFFLGVRGLPAVLLAVQRD